MAHAKLTITDGPEGLTVVLEADPPIPLDAETGEVQIDDVTDVQAAGLHAAQSLSEAAGESTWRVLDLGGDDPG